MFVLSFLYYGKCGSAGEKISKQISVSVVSSIIMSVASAELLAIIEHPIAEHLMLQQFQRSGGHDVLYSLINSMLSCPCDLDGI